MRCQISWSFVVIIVFSAAVVCVQESCGTGKAVELTDMGHGMGPQSQSVPVEMETSFGACERSRKDVLMLNKFIDKCPLVSSYDILTDVSRLQKYDVEKKSYRWTFMKYIMKSGTLKDDEDCVKIHLVFGLDAANVDYTASLKRSVAATRKGRVTNDAGDEEIEIALKVRKNHTPRPSDGDYFVGRTCDKIAHNYKVVQIGGRGEVVEEIPEVYKICVVKLDDSRRLLALCFGVQPDCDLKAGCKLSVVDVCAEDQQLARGIMGRQNLLRKEQSHWVVLIPEALPPVRAVETWY